MDPRFPALPPRSRWSFFLPSRTDLRRPIAGAPFPCRIRAMYDLSLVKVARLPNPVNKRRRAGRILYKFLSPAMPAKGLHFRNSVRSPSSRSARARPCWSDLRSRFRGRTATARANPLQRSIPRNQRFRFRALSTASPRRSGRPHHRQAEAEAGKAKTFTLDGRHPVFSDRADPAHHCRLPKDGKSPARAPPSMTAFRHKRPEGPTIRLSVIGQQPIPGSKEGGDGLNASTSDEHMKGADALAGDGQLFFDRDAQKKGGRAVAPIYSMSFGALRERRLAQASCWITNDFCDLPRRARASSMSRMRRDVKPCKLTPVAVCLHSSCAGREPPPFHRPKRLFSKGIDCRVKPRQ